MNKLLLSLLALAPLFGAPSDELAELVRERVQELPALDAEGLWRESVDLWSLAEGAGDEAAREALAPMLADEALPAAGRLVVAAALLQTREAPVEEIADLARALLADGDPRHAEAAAGLLSSERFRSLGHERRAALVKSLLEAAQDGTRPPGVRIHAGRAAWILGRGQDRRVARRELIDFLGSSDPLLRGRAALALASLGDEVTGPLQDELERLSRAPGEAGDLAESYLNAELAHRRSERKYKELLRDFEDRLLPDELAQFQRVVEMIEEAHLDGDKVTREELLDAALDGMLGAMDEHSSYMSPETYGRFFQDLEAQYGGIGAYVGEDQTDGLFTITRPIYSGPAYEAGLATDDKIVRIDDWPTIGEPVDDIIKRLKGRPGTRLKLYVWRAGMDTGLIDRPTEDMAVEITRAQIEIPSVKVDMLPGGVGLIELRDFSRVAAKEVREGLQKLEAEGMQSLILDLRSNAGGLLPQAVAVADLFLPPGLRVVSTESRVYASRVHETRYAPEIPTDVPMAVLIDRFSASAAEIVAGALQDHHRAELIGERSFGKGSVQDLVRVTDTVQDEFVDENGNGRYDNWERLTRDHDGDGEFDFAPHVKLTIARYLLPSGRSIHRELDEDRNVVQAGGIDPDQEVRRDRREYWRLEEFNRIARVERKPKEYVSERWEPYRDLFRDLAACDYRDPERYPDFDEFYESLDTPLPRDDVRYLLRQEIRRRVQDDRGAAFPFADFQEDAQVQTAVATVLEPRGMTPEDIAEYRATFQADDLSKSQPPLAVLDHGLSRDAVNSGRALLIRALDEGQALTEDDLTRLLDVLNGVSEEL